MEPAHPVSYAPAPGRQGIWYRLPQPLRGLWVLLAALVLSSAATVLGLALSHWLPLQSMGLVYILAVVIAAVGLGVWTGVAVALLAFPAYNFFFIAPVFTFTVADPKELFALVVFLAVALVTGSLAGATREVADAAQHRAVALQSLNDFAARLSGSRNDEAIFQALARQAADTVGGKAVVLVGAGGDLAPVAQWPGPVALATSDWQSARRALRAGMPVLATARGWPGGRLEFYPIVTSKTTIGVLGILPDSQQRDLSGNDQVPLETMLRHTAIAIERTELGAEAAQARAETERERLRSALLSSLSHDLRTPLASIVGAVTSLRQLGSAMSPETRDDLLVAIEEEAGRLSRFVANLLQMTRLETETIDLLADWVDVRDVVQTAATRARLLQPEAKLAVHAPAGLPAIRGDATLLDHVVFNLLDNAIKYSDSPAVIDVELKAETAAIILAVTDRGRGIPKEAHSRIFEPFFRANPSDGRAPGTGLGLAISKRIIEGMGGNIHVESPIQTDRGTRIVVSLPTPAARSQSLVCVGEMPA